MFGGGPHQQDVVAAALPRAPPSTKDALAIVPQDLEAVTHRHRNLCRSLSGEGYHHAAARHGLRRYIRSHDYIRIHLGDRGAIDSSQRSLSGPAFTLRRLPPASG